MTTNLIHDDWVPEACTLPTVEQPVRRSEFDDLFARDVLAVFRESPNRIRLELRSDPATAARAADLAAKEAGCCSFFSFQLVIAEGQVSLAIETTPAHQPVLEAFGARAESRAGAAS
ncbi:MULTISPECIES: hypothetical protein [unclassified Nocardioides]|uniref:hypothetical protein n=1 Tax=unclassified Nocardioides TaxID=2615069 RepID=UPI00070162B5|nr:MULTISPECIES: hypothetical protein [unclassified Nocardioides]KQY57383.1 arsenate reductase [Nocardioides sp. Root140]KQZ68896.1 arsenate reductase [Nocardioides sp. Root151]KRF20427.1 arsenate reductase [Nocardioides sp. Soil796]